MQPGGQAPGGVSRSASRATKIGRYVFVGWLVAAPVLVVVALSRRRQELEQIGEALWTADPHWIAVGIGIEALTVLVAGLAYHLLLRRLGYRLSCLTLASAHLQRCAAGAISPLSGPTSVYVLVQLLAQRRVPTPDGLLTVALRSAAGQIAFVLTLVVGLALLQPTVALSIAGGFLGVSPFRFALLRVPPPLLPAPSR